MFMLSAAPIGALLGWSGSVLWDRWQLSRRRPRQDRELLQEAGGELRRMALARFAAHGSGDVRGAAMWDCGTWLVEDFAEERAQPVVTLADLADSQRQRTAVLLEVARDMDDSA